MADQRELLHEIFTAIDANKDGKIDYEELSHALRKSHHHFAPHVIKNMIRLFDHGKRGTITFDEFVQLSQFLAEMNKSFSACDVDHNKRIDAEELGRLLLDMGFNVQTQHIISLLREVDGDRSGTVEFEEFVDLSFILRFLDKIFRSHGTYNISHGRIVVSGADEVTQLLGEVGYVLEGERVQQLVRHEVEKKLREHHGLLFSDFVHLIHIITTEGDKTALKKST